VKRLIGGLTVCVLVAASSYATACSFDTDCQPGSKCIKPGGGLYGYCAGGLSPGNANDRRPVYDALDGRGTRGNTCSFDIDCGPGGKCAKSGLYGVCL
jgi:hypothetical protein